MIPEQSQPQLKQQQQSQQITYKKVILTIKGEYQPPTISPLSSLSSYTVLAHQPIHAHPCKTTSKPLTMQTLNFHRKNPITLENMSYTATMLQHQILQIQQNTNNSNNKVSSNQIVVVDSSGIQGRQKLERTPQILRKYTVIRGYNYQLPKSICDKNYIKFTKDVQLLISYQNISKELEYTFGTVGSAGDEQRGFIGQVDLAYHWENAEKGSVFYRQAVCNLLRGYLEFSGKCGCPVFINLLPLGCPAYTITNNRDKLAQPQYQKYINLLSMHEPNSSSQSPSHNSNLILINPQLIFTRQHQSSSTSSSSQTFIQYTNAFQQQIQYLYTMGYNILFDLSRYGDSQMCLYWIAKYMWQCPKQTVISAGLKFKIDFGQFGGAGLSIGIYLEQIKGFIEQLQSMEQNQSNKFKVDQLIQLTTKTNIINLLAWFTKKIVKVQVKMWKCVHCGKQLPESQEAFKKFNKNFCSINCLRAFKF